MLRDRERGVLPARCRYQLRGKTASAVALHLWRTRKSRRHGQPCIAVIPLPLVAAAAQTAIAV